ncbi:MAG: hypothetical protein JWN24_4593 [Phycisphaerales bacterium]|nr:hypothetical protein [Phycisphaerales bacterium]
MADDAQTIRNINWRELFPFTNLFRTFRIAIHPSKLVLGLALLFLVYAGGRTLDWIWPVRSYAVADEIDRYEAFRWAHARGPSFEDHRQAMREANAESYASRLMADKIVTDPAAAHEAALRGEYKGSLRGNIVKARNEEIAKAQTARAEALKTAKTDEERRQINAASDEAIAGAQQKADEELRSLNAISPRAIFDTFFEYEARQFHNIVDNAVTWNWLNGVLTASPSEPPSIVGRHPTDVRGINPVGVLRGIANLTSVGPAWLIRYHLLYFILFAIWFLIVWAIFGGALSRIAAVHVARDEKISVRQALRFSTSKLLSFVFAPVIPLIIILAAGALIALGGLLMYLPVVGPILVGLLFVLPLVAAFVMTLVAAGTVGGFNLMYPTIAVEGSDSFDAISRSFSYVFARPWRMIFYTALSLIYGALCFLFVRYFVYVMLGLTHFFVQWWLGGQPARYWPEIWPPISDQDLSYHINFQALAWSEQISAFLISFWVYLVLTLMAAFVISFYFSANTIIYFLMRREVDATELDDVYVEETEEDFGEPIPTVTAVGGIAVVSATTPAPESPSSPSPS